jgi:pyruvate dehydrogenase E1 component alpha subunit
MGDPERYRKPEEVKSWMDENDPIGSFRSYLIEQKLASEKELADAEKRAQADVQAAVEFAEASPEPAAETLFDHVYADGEA